MTARYLPGPPPKTKAIIDIIPVLSFSNGRRVELGVARYEVEEEWRDMPSFTIQNVTPYGRIDNLGWAHMEFIVRLSSASQPQPQAIDAVSAYPPELVEKILRNASYGTPQAEMAAPVSKWRDAQGHPVDQFGVRIEPKPAPHLDLRQASND